MMTFLKVDKGLAEQVDGVRMMHPLPDLDATLARARAKGVFGTKMRSVIQLATPPGSSVWSTSSSTSPNRFEPGT